MKIRPAGAELFHTDGRTERYDEAYSSFSKVRESAPKNSQVVTAVIKYIGKTMKNVCKINSYST
jgi:hypothetical protein